MAHLVLCVGDGCACVCDAVNMRVRNHTNPFRFHETITPDSYQDLLTQLPSALSVEIGFGRGVFLRHFATQYPDKCILGIEVRKPLVGLLQERLDAQNSHNAHLIHGEAKMIITHLLNPSQITELFIFHPDPWLKKRHHKRRVITPDFLTAISPQLAPQARILIATDVASLYEDMTQTFLNTTCFTAWPEDPFWTTAYPSHWHTFSQKDKRNSHCMTFIKQA